MANQVDSLLNPVTTSTGQTITTGINNAVQGASNFATSTGSIIVDSGATIGAGIIAGAVNQAVAPVVDIAQKANTIYELVKNPSLGGALALLGKGFPPYRNELHEFASYNYVFTLGCLTDLELNFPLSYRTLGPLIKILRSGGVAGNKIPSIYDIDGAREFFIEDVDITTIPTPTQKTRQSSATLIKFKVIEPYSMGQFYNNLKTAATASGHADYLEAPFVLSVAFIGYDEDGNIKAPLFSQRHFPIYIARADMKVTGAGATYDVTAIPFNEKAFTDNVQTVKTDITIKGKTVGEMLQSGAESLTARLNERAAELQKAQQVPTPDTYIISFPQDGILSSALGGTLSNIGATIGNSTDQLIQSIVGENTKLNPEKKQEIVNARLAVTTKYSALAESLKSTANNSGLWNKVGLAKITENFADSSTQPVAPASGVESKEQPGHITGGKSQEADDLRQHQYTQKSTIMQIIEEVIIQSAYGRGLKSQVPDSNGQINWFRVDAHTYNAGDMFSSFVTGTSPKIYVYRVVEYKVDASAIASPATVLPNFMKQSGAVKAYNYIYTGQNDDIIDFNIEFKHAFFNGVNATRGQRAKDVVLGAVNSIINPGPVAPTTTGGGLGGNTDAKKKVKDIAESSTGKVGGGGGAENTDVQLARNFNDMILNSSNDMLLVTLKINGDPYYLADAGLGNYIGLTNPINSHITIEGSMNPINGIIPVILNFRTPIDYDQDSGWVEYPLGGFLPVNFFSGLYSLLRVQNKFVKGQFTQELKLSRQNNQDLSATAILGALVSGGTKGFKAIGEGIKANILKAGGDTAEGMKDNG